MIEIDGEFEALIPPLADDEYSLLEESILTEGFHSWEPIVIWNNTIIDGHNRYRICLEHSIKFVTKEIKFDSRDAAKIWIIKHQFRRRNLSPGQRAALAIDLNEAQLREQARLRTAEGNKAGGGDHRSAEYRKKRLGPQGAPTVSDTPQPSDDKPRGRTAEILGKMAGVGHMTIKRAMKIKQENEELYDQVRKGEIPVTSAYEQVVGKKPYKRGRKVRRTEDGRRICTICGEPIDEGGSYGSRPSAHKTCYDKHIAELQYANPDKSLIDNVAIYSIDSLINELKESVETMRAAVSESITINQSMGVSIPERKIQRVSKAINGVVKAIDAMKEEQ